MGQFKGFSQVKLRRPQRSMFDLSHEKKLSTRMGRLTPIMMTEVMPNDTFKVSSEVMIRLAPLLAPIYHRVNCFVHHFFVPNRILWKDWEPFITGGRLGTETPPVPPWIDIPEIGAAGLEYLNTGSLADYLGMATISDASTVNYATNQGVQLMPFAAYWRVWYDYYRDRNYEPDVNEDDLKLSSGLYAGSLARFFNLRTRAWQHDYFTSALPWTQRGQEVLMPLEGDATINYRNAAEAIDSSTGLPAANLDVYVESGIFGNQTGTTALGIHNLDEVTFQNSSVSINDLRQAIRLQEWLERNAVAGSRYNESIMAHFGRKTSDGRLQRAEYLGGGRVPVQISEVMTTAWSQDGDANNIPPADMAGRGITYGSNNRFKRNFEEHGFVISILSVMPTSAYMQGSHRMFGYRTTFLDYPWPSFANLGEQPVFDSEIYTTSVNWPSTIDGTSTQVFGYQSRYADWKWIPSTAHGDFKTTLDFWHLDRKFASQPNLGASFVTFEDELQDRIFAVAETDTLWCYVHNNVRAIRSLPYFGTPLL